jgi:hypothetical protein
MWNEPAAGIGTKAAGRYPRRQREEVALPGLGSDKVGIEVFNVR